MQPINSLPLINRFLMLHLCFIGLFNNPNDHLQEKYFDIGGKDIRADRVYFDDGTDIGEQGVELFCVASLIVG
jgi:hypothetical protein